MKNMSYATDAEAREMDRLDRELVEAKKAWEANRVNPILHENMVAAERAVAENGWY